MPQVHAAFRTIEAHNPGDPWDKATEESIRPAILEIQAKGREYGARTPTIQEIINIGGLQDLQHTTEEVKALLAPTLALRLTGKGSHPSSFAKCLARSTRQLGKRSGYGKGPGNP